MLRGDTFALSPGSVEVHRQQMRGNGLLSGEPFSATALEALRTSAARAFGDLPSSKTVFYPMSGYDAGTPVHLFPDATTIIGLDNHPFLFPGDTRRKIPFSEVGTHNFAWNADVDRLGYVGPAVIGALRDAVPSFRLHHVTLIEHPDQISVQKHDVWQPPQTDAVHAVVEFDSGPGTPMRRYIHIHGSLDQGEGVMANWWWKMLQRERPDALLVKGAEMVFRRTALALRDPIIDWLRSKNGVVFEDRRPQDGEADFSDDRQDPSDTRGWTPRMVHDRSQSVNIAGPGLRFGYSVDHVGVLVTRFSP